MEVFMTTRKLAAALLLPFGLMISAPAHATAPAKAVEIKGEVIDTWCFFSGVMGGEDAVVGSAHHTCALWCAAGGIPVGVRTDEGDVYMILKYEGQDVLERNDTVMEVQSDIITARGMHYVRDGVNYLVVEKVVSNDGIKVLNHLDYGSVPPNSFPLDE
jgi:hypothetical protein